jgi:hypothetical protein
MLLNRPSAVMLLNRTGGAETTRGLLHINHLCTYDYMALCVMLLKRAASITRESVGGGGVGPW